MVRVEDTYPLLSHLCLRFPQPQHCRSTAIVNANPYDYTIGWMYALLTQLAMMLPRQGFDTGSAEDDRNPFHCLGVF